MFSAILDRIRKSGSHVTLVRTAPPKQHVYMVVWTEENDADTYVDDYLVFHDYESARDYYKEIVATRDPYTVHLAVVLGGTDHGRSVSS